MLILPQHLVRQPAGHILVDGQVVADTLQCVHCGAHWVVRPGSRRRRGWCLRCGGPTCGQPECDACRPMEQQLERMERGE